MELNHEILSFQAPQLLIERFCREEVVRPREAVKRFEETKRFLYLCSLNPEAAYSPSKTVDEMWHRFILHTRDYQEFCRRLGCFIHHQPSEVPQPENYERTRKDLKKLFGKVSRKYWGKRISVADCDDCSSSCDCCP